MPRRSTRKRKAAATSAGHGQGASKQQGDKRKSAPAPVRQTSPLATVLTPDTLGRSLSFLDVSSLVRSEMTAKFVQGAAVGVWTALDKKIGAGKKVAGNTARDRVIRSSRRYRHFLLAEYAAKVEMMKPSNTETVQYDLGYKLSKKLDFYVRFAKVNKSDKDDAEVGTTFLAGGVFKPTMELAKKFGRGNGIAFDLTELDLSKWKSMEKLLGRGEGWTFLDRYESSWDHEGAYDDRISVLKDVRPTIVAIDRKSLALSIVMASDFEDCIDGCYRDDQWPVPNHVEHTQGTMYPSSWKYSDLDDDEFEEMFYYDDEMRFSDFLFFNEGLKFLIRG